MTRFLFTLLIAILTTTSLWSKDDEIIVTRQLTTGQRSSLPEKTITVESRRLAFNKKADSGLTDAIIKVMDTIAQEDYQNRTFVLLVEPRSDGEIAIAAHSDDILTQGRQDATIYYGVIDHKRYHFVVLTGKDNLPLLEQTFKRQGKVKFVQEFEIVEFKTLNYPTNVIGTWSPEKGFRLLTVIINENPETERDLSIRPTESRD